MLGDGARRVGVGLLLGLGGAVAVTRLLRSVVTEVGPSDPGAMVGAAGALAVVALLACYLPARQAMRADPLAVLRED